MKATLRRLIFLAALCPLLSLPAKDDGQVLRLLPSNTILLKGRTLDFRARIGEGGSDAEDGKDVTERITDWISSVPTVAAISDDGHLVALQIGATTVSGTYKGLRATALVTVDAVTAAPFLVQPSGTKVNTAIAPAVKVAVQGNLGRPLPGLRVTIGIAPRLGTPPGALSGTLARVTDANGAVSFGDLKLNYMGGYFLQATVATPTGQFISTSAGFSELPLNPCLATVTSPVDDYFNHLFLGCPDSDGDGLFDAWEAAGGIDFDGDGIVSPWEKVLAPV